MLNRNEFIRNIALLTLGVGITKVAPAAALKKTPPPELLINAGIAGNTTKNLLARVQHDCLDYRPGLTIMMIGTNDMVNGKHVPIDQYRKNLDTLAKMITMSGSRLLMLSILPFYEPYLLTRHPADFFQPEGPEGRRQQVNKVIKEVASACNVSFFDISTLFEKVGMIGTGKYCLLRNKDNSGKTDGVHPTPEGYRFMALAISEFIHYNNLMAGRIVCLGDSITKGDGSTDRYSYPAFLKKLIA